MLVLPIKGAVRYDLSLALGRWLDDSDQTVAFSLTDPLQFVIPKPAFSSVSCKSDLTRLQSLRNCLSDCLLKPTSHKNALQENGLDDCHEYHAVVLEFEKKGFPSTENKDSSIQITWLGAFSPLREAHSTLVWERACIMFNIVALLTQQISECSVTDRDDCKRSVSLSQQAASLLCICRELCSSQTDPFATVDLSNPMLSFWEKFLLATAQTNIYRMASLNTQVADAGKHHRTLAVLSKASFDLYNAALTAAKDPRLQSEVPDSADIWAQYCKAHSIMAISKANYHQSVVYRVNAEHGKEIAQLRDCLEKLQSCRDFPMEQHAEYAHREYKAIFPVVQDRLQIADQENLQTYHEDIPQRVPDIPSQQLAKINPALPQTMLIPQRPMFVGL